MFNWGKSKLEKKFDKYIETADNLLKITYITFEVDPEDAYLHHFISGVALQCLAFAGSPIPKDEETRIMITKILIGGEGQLLLSIFKTKEDQLKAINFHNNLMGARIKIKDYVFSEIKDIKKMDVFGDPTQIRGEGADWFRDVLEKDMPNKSGIAFSLYEHLKNSKV